MEYDKEFIDKILEKAVGSSYQPNHWNLKIDFGTLKKLLESFLPASLPPCPICGEDVCIGENSFGWHITCSKVLAHIAISGEAKQESIDAYLSTPYCKMYKENKQVSKWMDEAHEYKVLCGEMVGALRYIDCWEGLSGAAQALISQALNACDEQNE